MKKFELLLVALCLVLGLSGTAKSTEWTASVQWGEGLESQMSFVLYTFNGEVDYDEVPMVFNDETGNWEITFAPDAAATNWRVEASPSVWFSDPVIICGEEINGVDNELGEWFIYIGPLR